MPESGAGGSRFFDESDPESAVARLAAQVATTGAPAHRRRTWRLPFGAAVTTGLVAGAFLFGLTQDDDGAKISRPVSARQATVGPGPGEQSVDPAPAVSPTPSASLPQATLRPVPAKRPEPSPQAPEAAPAGAGTNQSPVQQASSKSQRPGNQVGPNRPIKAPIDPDDR